MRAFLCFCCVFTLKLSSVPIQHTYNYTAYGILILSLVIHMGICVGICVGMCSVLFGTSFYDQLYDQLFDITRRFAFY